jgi:hypothetical protein
MPVTQRPAEASRVGVQRSRESGIEQSLDPSGCFWVGVIVIRL